jgi:hypothetical protein
MSQTSLGKGRRFSYVMFAILFVAVWVLSAHQIVNAQQTPTPTGSPAAEPDPWKAIQWRLIGPFRGGRSTAVAGVASQPLVYYFGGTAAAFGKQRRRHQLGTNH